MSDAGRVAELEVQLAAVQTEAAVMREALVSAQWAMEHPMDAAPLKERVDAVRRALSGIAGAELLQRVELAERSEDSAYVSRVHLLMQRRAEAAEAQVATLTRERDLHAQIATDLSADIANLVSERTAERDSLKKRLADAIEACDGEHPEVSMLKRRMERLEEALEFYANPETYFAIGFFPDSPTGDFMDDFDDTGELGFKPGKRARSALSEGKEGA